MSSSISCSCVNLPFTTSRFPGAMHGPGAKDPPSLLDKHEVTELFVNLEEVIEVTENIAENLQTALDGKTIGDDFSIGDLFQGTIARDPRGRSGTKAAENVPLRHYMRGVYQHFIDRQKASKLLYDRIVSSKTDRR